MVGPVAAGKLRGRINGVGPPATEKDLASAIGAICAGAGSVLSGAVREIGERVVGLELPHLRRHRIDDLCSPVADVAVPEAGGHIKKALAILSPDVLPPRP